MEAATNSTAPLGRRALAAGITGAAMSLLPWLASRTSATATTAPPLRPTDDDKVLLSFAQGVELTIRDLYDDAINGGVFTDAGVAANMVAIRESHEAYSQSISGMLARQAPNTRNEDFFQELKGDMAGDATTVTQALATLENIAVATHTDLVGMLKGIDGAAVLSAILVVEARHATVLNTLAGAASLDDQLAATATALVSPTN